MCSVQPPLTPLMDIRCKNHSLTRTLILECLTPYHCDWEVSIILLHCDVNLIGLQVSMIPFLYCHVCKQRSMIHTLHSIKWGAFHWMQYPSMCGKLSQQKAIYGGILSGIYKHPRYCSIPPFTHSIRPSGCWWNAVDIHWSNLKQSHI